MGVRERASEYGVLRAIGFLPRHITIWIVGESLALGLLGGLWGLLLAWPIINLGFSRFVEENMGGFFPYFRLETANMVLGLSLAALLGAGASMIPASRCARRRRSRRRRASRSSSSCWRRR
jgi:putative ABC transport system permease protein